MKNITFILALFILAIAIMPCSDEETCVEENTVLTEKHDHSEDSGDLCSPFCYCSCCGIKISLQKDRLPMKSFADMTDAYFFSYEFLYTSSYIEKVWHPPAIC